MSEKSEAKEISEENNTLELTIKELRLRIRFQWIADLFKMFLSLPLELVRMLLQIFKKRPNEDDWD
jgi:hypothetical protein